MTICNGDCDDSNPSVNPAATEQCDGVDEDCDGQVDEDDVCIAPCIRAHEIAALDISAGRLLLYDYRGTATECATGFANPIDVEVDAQGGFYIADHGAASVLYVDPACTTTHTVVSYFTDGIAAAPWDLTIDPGGLVYVADRALNTVWRLDPGGPVAFVGPAQGIADPVGVSWGPDGLLYVVARAGAEIWRFDANGASVDGGAPWLTPVAGYTDISGLTHACGETYFGANDDNQVWACAAGDASSCAPLAATIPWSAPMNPFDVAVDCECNIYVTASGQNEIQLVPASGAALTTFASPANGISAGGLGPTGLVIRP